MSCPTKIVSPENWYFLNGRDPQLPPGKFLSDPHHGSPVNVVSHRSVRYLLFYFQSREPIYRPFSCARTHHDYLKAFCFKYFFFLSKTIYLHFVRRNGLYYFFLSIKIYYAVYRCRVLYAFSEAFCSVYTS